MKLTTKLPDGRLQVNKEAVIAHLKHRRKEKFGAELPGLIGVSRVEVEAEARELTRYNLDSFINTSEE